MIFSIISEDGKLEIHVSNGDKAVTECLVKKSS